MFIHWIYSLSLCLESQIWGVEAKKLFLFEDEVMVEDEETNDDSSEEESYTDGLLTYL